MKLREGTRVRPSFDIVDEWWLNDVVSADRQVKALQQKLVRQFLFSWTRLYMYMYMYEIVVVPVVVHVHVQVNVHATVRACVGERRKIVWKPHNTSSTNAMSTGKDHIGVCHSSEISEPKARAAAAWQNWPRTSFCKHTIWCNTPNMAAVPSIFSVTRRELSPFTVLVPYRYTSAVLPRS